MTVVELVGVYLGKHITADGRVVGVGDKPAAKYNLDKRVCEAHSHCVDKQVTWLRGHCLKADLVVG